jgi:hypothetical protein
MLRQRGGFALIAILSLAALITAFLIASGLNRSAADVSNERDARNMKALAQAKAALIAYAADTDGWQAFKLLANDQPGALPCPTILADDGSADCAGPGISPNTSLIGRLPWQHMGAEDLRDATGERLWYAVSYNFRKNFGTTVINSDTPGQLDVIGDTPASKVVAVVFAPGPPLTGQNRPALTTDPAHNAPANYLESFDLSDAFNYKFTSNVQPSSAFNDRLVVITQGELMAAVEPVVAGRIERQIKPLIASYFSVWGAYPFAAPFPAGVPPPDPGPGRDQVDYKGAGLANGLLPLTTTTDPLWLTWVTSSITIAQIAGGTGSPVIDSWTCGSSTPNQISCQIDYHGASGTPSNDRPAISLQAALANATNSFVDPTLLSAADVTMTDAFGNPLTGASPFFAWSASSPPLIPAVSGAAQANGGLMTFTGRLRNPASTNNRVFITISKPVPKYLPIVSGIQATNPNGAWFIANQWYRQTYYAVSPGFVPGGGGTCNPYPTMTPPSCLQVNYVPSTTNNNQAILVFSGRTLNGSLNLRPNANLPDYLEHANLTAAQGTTPFAYEHRSGTPTDINDRVVVISHN